MIPALRTRARFLVHDQAAADDLVQDVLERALNAEARFRSGSDLAAWLNTIMRNRVIDSHRRGMTRESYDAAATVADEDCSVVDVLSMSDIHAALSSLERASREIFSRAYLDEQSYQEIANALGIPINTVATRLRRARHRLRPLLAPIYEARLRAMRRPATD